MVGKNAETATNNQIINLKVGNKYYLIMKTIKKALRPIAFFFASLIMFTSCEQYDNDADSSLAKYEGLELFKSIMFADGAATMEFEMLSRTKSVIDNFDSEKLSSYREAQNKVINYISNTNPEYFEEFKNKINSNDANLISTALNESVIKIKSFLAMESEKENINLNKYLVEHENDLDLSDYSGEDINGVGLWVLVTVLVVLFIVVNVNVTSTVNMDVLQEDVGYARSMHSIDHQSFVLEILEK